MVGITVTRKDGLGVGSGLGTEVGVIVELVELLVARMRSWKSEIDKVYLEDTNDPASPPIVCKYAFKME